jgi:hypothetical protein
MLSAYADFLKLAIAANHSLKVDMTRLWESTPQKLPNVGPSSSPSPKGYGNSMADVLDEITSTPSKRRSLSPPLPPAYDILQGSNTSKRYGNLTSNSQSSYTSNMQQTQQGIRTPAMALKNLSLGDYETQLSQAITNIAEDQDVMDWAPIQTQSKHRAFNSIQPTDSGTQLFGQAPVQAESGAMWFHVPPAPISPAHRLRNPPNQPRLRVSSQETKQNFFSRVTRQSKEPSNSTEADADSEPSEDVRPRRNVEFAQQKFFPTGPPSESGERLAELMTSFTLSSDPETSENSKTGYDLRHLFQAIALWLGLLFWNRVLHDPSDHTKNVSLVVMGGCGLIGARTVLDNLQLKPKGFSRTAGAVLGALEMAAAGYGVQEILAGRGSCEYCAPLGSLFIGVMAVCEMLHL